VVGICGRAPPGAVEVPDVAPPQPPRISALSHTIAARRRAFIDPEW
jgi:hypothetical protein